MATSQETAQAMEDTLNQLQGGDDLDALKAKAIVIIAGCLGTIAIELCKTREALDRISRKLDA
jgi:hypothetical protein